MAGPHLAGGMAWRQARIDVRRCGHYWPRRAYCTADVGRRQLLTSLQLFSIGDRSHSPGGEEAQDVRGVRNPYQALMQSMHSARRCSAWEWVLDVRSPGEFEEDRIVGGNVLNLPVLDNEERSAVGTEFTRGAKHRARMEGASIISTRIGQIIERDLSGRTKEGDRLLIYCWRGGMRSRSLATVLNHVGFKVQLLEGGYRSYRRAVSAFLDDGLKQFRFVVISGPTGSGKGRLLEELAKEGGQVLDLEGLAMHRGSTFGAMEGCQPSQKLFESKLAAEFASMVPERPVFVESESNRVGTCHLPLALTEGMRGADRVEVTVPLRERVKWIRSCYGHFEDPLQQETLFKALGNLAPIVGNGRVDSWKHMAADSEWDQLVEELLVMHYDPAYAKSRKRLALEVKDNSEVELGDLGNEDDLRSAALSLLSSRDPVMAKQ